jgi:rhodanese-related sulfurtransferase
MKELEKVKRISIASTVFILAILIGVLTFERPKNMYANNTKNTLENLISKDYLISLNEIEDPQVELIDVRSEYEYDRGHLVNAINISSADILNEENQSILNQFKESNKTIVLYGKDPQEANIPFMMLYQLGFDNIKVLSAKINYLQNKLLINKSNIEKLIGDIKAFIYESQKNSKVTIVEQKVEPAPKKVIPVQKKKKKPVEGGC